MGKNQMKYRVSNNIAELRRLKGLSQESLGKYIGVTRATINAIEKENYNPSLDLAFRIAVFFEQTIDDIFHIEDKHE